MTIGRYSIPATTTIRLVPDWLQLATNPLNARNSCNGMSGQNLQADVEYATFFWVSSGRDGQNSVFHGSFVLKDNSGRGCYRCHDSSYLNNHQSNPLQKVSSRKFDSIGIGLDTLMHRHSALITEAAPVVVLKTGANAFNVFVGRVLEVAKRQINRFIMKVISYFLIHSKTSNRGIE